MTVLELINLLEQMDETMEVELSTSSMEWSGPLRESDLVDCGNRLVITI